MTWQVVVLPTASKMLSDISDRRVQGKIIERLRALRTDPDKQGKPLGEDLSGFRAVRAVGQRYRIIYKVDRGRVVVLVVAIGLRKEKDSRDIYALAGKLARFGLLP